MGALEVMEEPPLERPLEPSSELPSLRCNWALGPCKDKGLIN